MKHQPFLQTLPRLSQHADWMVIAMLVMLASVALVRVFYPRQFNRVVLAFTSNYEARRLLTERNARTMQMSVMLQLLAFQSVAFFFVIQDLTFSVDYAIASQYLGPYVLITLIVSLFFLLRKLLLRWLGSVFRISDMTEQINQVYTVNLIFLGLMFLIIDIPAAFTPEPYNPWIVYAGFVVLLLWNLFTVYRIYLAMSKNRVLLLYRILYLCAFEIIPWWWIIKISIKGWST